jgi:hypothetical protein
MTLLSREAAVWLACAARMHAAAAVTDDALHGAARLVTGCGR